MDDDGWNLCMTYDVHMDDSLLNEEPWMILNLLYNKWKEMMHRYSTPMENYQLNDWWSNDDKVNDSFN
jgi:hypothetical protein